MMNKNTEAYNNIYINKKISKKKTWYNIATPENIATILMYLI